MTGYGRGSFLDKDYKILIEIKSLNHRYCDILVKTPKKLHFLEPSIKKILQKEIGRGKIEVGISYENLANKSSVVKYNQDLAKEYHAKLTLMAKELDIKMDIGAYALSKYPEVLALEEVEMAESELWSKIEKTLARAIENFIDSREAEGINLKNDIFDKLEKMDSLVDEIEAFSPNVVETYANNLRNKVTELLDGREVDDTLLITEIAIFADKICTNEEIIRLKSHINNMIKTFNDDEDNIGRKLDFISQEMLREANTILSKSNDIKISNTAIDLKTNIEKIREQVQNVE